LIAGSVVVPALSDLDAGIISLPKDPIDESVLGVDPARPPTGKLPLQGLWFSYPVKRAALHVFQYRHEALG
jgi:hypothetical protein